MTNAPPLPPCTEGAPSPLSCPRCGHMGSTDHGTLMHGIACSDRLLAGMVRDVPAYLTDAGELRPEIAAALAGLDVESVGRAIDTLAGLDYRPDGSEAARRGETAALGAETQRHFRVAEAAATQILNDRASGWCSCGSWTKMRPVCGVHDIAVGTHRAEAEHAFAISTLWLLNQSELEAVVPYADRWIDEVGIRLLSAPPPGERTPVGDPLGLLEETQVGFDI